MSLNGTWKFHWSPTPSQTPKGFQENAYSVEDWDDITVPYPWQVYAARNGKPWDKPLYVKPDTPSPTTGKRSA